MKKKWSRSNAVVGLGIAFCLGFSQMETVDAQDKTMLTSESVPTSIDSSISPNQSWTEISETSNLSASPDSAIEPNPSEQQPVLETSEETTLSLLARAFWRIVNALRVDFLWAPANSSFWHVNQTEVIDDPRAPREVVPSQIDLEGKIPDPDWFVGNVRLQAAGASYISAYSASMSRDIPLIWVPAPDRSTPRPVVYALDGRGGGEWASFILGTEIIDRARELNLNIVMPASGANSNYLDWYDDSQVSKGKQQWETFLTKELPSTLEDAMGANGQRSIVGMSMSGGSVFILAQHNPGFYDAVGGISGCGESNSFLARGSQQMVLRDLGSVEDLYGPYAGLFNRYNDSLTNAKRLAGTKLIYNFNAGGFLGTQDFDPAYSPKTPFDWLSRIFNGSLIEFTTGACAHRMEAALKTAGIPATFEYATSGAHNWGVFNQGTNRFMKLLGERVYPNTTSH